MSNIWDLPETKHLVHGRKSGKKVRRTQKRTPEEQMSSGVTSIVKTASDFTMGAMGIAVMSNLGSQVITSLSKK